MANSTLEDPELREALDSLAPSAKLVAKTLEYEGGLSQAELAEQTRLPERTVRSGIRDLETIDVIRSRPSFMDARKRIYSLDPSRDG